MSIHYTSGSTYPEKTGEQIRLYNNYICPYAQRARHVLNHKNIPHEIVNIHLFDKPKWFLKKSPMGKVPVLEHGDKILCESLIVCDYLDEVFPEKPLHPKDPYEKACQRVLLEKYGKVIGSFYKLLNGKDVEEAKAAVVQDLKEFEDTLKDSFFGGNEPSMLDFMMYPWIERFVVIKDLVNFDVFQAGSFPKLEAWVDKISATPSAKASCIPKEHLSKFFQLRAAGQTQYDF